MIQIKNLDIMEKKDLRELVSGLSFVINDGDKMAVIGEEGNGKSTLLKLIYDEGMVQDYIEYSGEIIRNQSVFGYLEQETRQEQKEKSVYEFLSEEPCFLEMEPGELAVYARQFRMPLELFYAEQRMGQLSGGEKVKIRMLRALCRKPDILLLDEPSNDLDLETLQWLEDFICGWKGGILYISHDETLLEHTANRILHLEQVRKKRKPRHTAAKQGYAEYVSERMSGLRKQEQMARKERSEYRKQQEKFRQIKQRVAHEQEVITRQDPQGARLLKKKMHAVKSMERRFEKESENMTELPDVEEAIVLKFSEMKPLPARKTVLDLSVSELSAGDRVLARNLSLRIAGRQKVCIVGKNGVGKTTLLKKIAEELLARTDIKAAYMPQDYEEIVLSGANHWKSGKTEEIVTPVSYLSETGEKEEITRIRTFLGSLKVTAEEMEHPVSELSGGQRAKLILLKLCMSGANVLLLDEPTRNLSPLSNPVIRMLLKQYEGAIISVSHDRKFIEEVCDRVVELTEEGFRESRLETFLTNPGIR